MSDIWVLTTEYNDYDQHGRYFVKAWIGKPTADQIRACGKVLHEDWSDDFIRHLLAGGGRQGVEYNWYHLEKSP